jgi:hypothetical protein
LGVGRKNVDVALKKKIFFFAKLIEVKAGWSQTKLAESSKEGDGSKNAVLPTTTTVMTVMMMMMIIIVLFCPETYVV